MKIERKTSLERKSKVTLGQYFLSACFKEKDNIFTDCVTDLD